ncbi:hypothetical protein VPH35_070613 [Triticum aestivum]
MVIRDGAASTKVGEKGRLHVLLICYAAAMAAVVRRVQQRPRLGEDQRTWAALKSGSRFSQSKWSGVSGTHRSLPRCQDAWSGFPWRESAGCTRAGETERKVAPPRSPDGIPVRWKREGARSGAHVQ